MIYRFNNKGGARPHERSNIRLFHSLLPDVRQPETDGAEQKMRPAETIFTSYQHSANTCRHRAPRYRNGTQHLLHPSATGNL